MYRARIRTVLRGPILVSTATLIFTAGFLTVAGTKLSAAPSFVPALLSIVVCFDLMSVYLLLGEYRDKGDPRLLAMCAAYVWSLFLMVGYGFAFPGVISSHPPLAFTASMAPWLYLGWHVGFPVLLGLAWGPWPVAFRTTTPAARRLSAGWLVLGATAVAAAGVVTTAAVFAHHLPVLILGRNTTRMTTLTAPVALPLVGLAVIAAWHGTRRRSGAERWSGVAVLVCLCDLTLTYTARYRFSMGWYAGRVLTLTAAGTVLLAMLAEFRRIKSRAEFNAAYDSLTGLHNRRTTHDTLGLLFPTARRSGAPLSVVLLDLDHFKKINDRSGHAAGDRVLVAVAAALSDCLRMGDLVGRVGGEEFVALLAGTDEAGGLYVAERMRSAVEATGLATASAGIATIRAGDSNGDSLLKRADEALYSAKRDGRNRVVAAIPPLPGPRTASEVTIPA